MRLFRGKKEAAEGIPSPIKAFVAPELPYFIIDVPQIDLRR